MIKMKKFWYLQETSLYRRLQHEKQKMNKDAVQFKT